MNMRGALHKTAPGISHADTGISKRLPSLSIQVPGDADYEPTKAIHYCHVLEAIPPTPTRSGKRVGGSCCDDFQNTVTKASVLMNMVCGTAWTECCTSRWTNVTSVVTRFTSCNVFGNFLSQSVQDWVVHWQLSDASVVTALERLIETDKENYTARTKLKLCRVASAFGKPLVLAETAIMAVTLPTADKVHWAVLGNGDKRPRATILDLIHPARSPVAIAQGRFAFAF